MCTDCSLRQPALCTCAIALACLYLETAPLSEKARKQKRETVHVPPAAYRKTGWLDYLGSLSIVLPPKY